MASSKFEGEIKGAMAQRGKQPPPKRGAKPYSETKAEAKAEGDTPAELARDKARGIKEGSPRDERLDMQAMHGNGPAPHQTAAAAGRVGRVLIVTQVAASLALQVLLLRVLHMRYWVTGVCADGNVT